VIVFSSNAGYSTEKDDRKLTLEKIMNIPL